MPAEGGRHRRVIIDHLALTPACGHPSPVGEGPGVRGYFQSSEAKNLVWRGGPLPIRRKRTPCGRNDTKPIPRWDVHCGGIDDDRKDATALHITFRPQLSEHRQCGLSICTFHLGFSLVTSTRTRCRPTGAAGSRFHSHDVTHSPGECWPVPWVSRA